MFRASQFTGDINILSGCLTESAAREISRLNVRRHRALPAWNYTLRPAREM